jgi:hypothetical protein
VSQVFRSGREAIVTAGTGIVLAAVLAGHSVEQHRNALAVMSWELLVAAAMSFGVYRFFMAGAYATAEALRVVNLFNSISVPWTDIEGFSVGSYGRWPAVAIIELRNGTHLPLVAIRAVSWSAGANGRVERTVRELERLRALRQGGGGTSFW